MTPHTIAFLLATLLLKSGLAIAADANPAPNLEITGKWWITQTNGVKALWKFNDNSTYNYWNETGTFAKKDNTYKLSHTWDWDVKMTNANTFDGICTRGSLGCKIHGIRTDESAPAKIVGRWNIVQSNNVKAVWTFNEDYTYNYWKEAGIFCVENNIYHLTHTWDWDIKMKSDDTFDGVCTRGKANCTIHGTRIRGAK